MRHEKIIKRENGDSVKIEVSVYVENYTYPPKAKYTVEVFLRNKRKKKWNQITDHDSYQWRRLNIQDREEFSNELFLKHTTKDEIKSAKEELWQLLKP